MERMAIAKNTGRDSDKFFKAFVAIYWLVARIVFVLIYILGIGLANKHEVSQGPDKQLIRSVAWAFSVGFLIDMTLNLL